MEIGLIILAGLLPIGLAIYNVLKSERQEKELKLQQVELNKAQNTLIDKQDQLYQLQIKYAEEIKDKTDQVFSLQNEQINNLTRLANPIPRTASVTFNSELDISDDEYDELLFDIRSSGVVTGNLLPTNFITSTPIVNKINQFKDVLCSITIVFTNENKKTIRIHHRTVPKFLGFNKTENLNHFILSYNEDKGKKFFFTGFHLRTDVEFNYDQSSFLDFANSSVEISIDFSTPMELRFGSQVEKKYKLDQKFVKIDLIDLTVNFEGYPSINLTQLKEVGNNRFKTSIN